MNSRFFIVPVLVGAGARASAAAHADDAGARNAPAPLPAALLIAAIGASLRLRSTTDLL